MNPFTSMVGQLHKFPLKSYNTKTKFVTREDYDIFCKEFVFEKLKGLTFGEAFCKKFNIEDYTLKNVSSEMARELIETLDYIK